MIEDSMDTLVDLLERIERSTIVLREHRHGPIGVRPSVEVETERMTFEQKVQFASLMAATILYHINKLDT
jgi:hypothetical protein